MKEQYKFNKFIFGAVFIINLFFLVSIIADNGADLFKPYKRVECPINSFIACEIPGEYPGANKTILQPGEYIENRNVNLEVASRFNKSVMLSLIVGLLVNHFFFNRKYKFKWIKKNVRF
jgi:hypothetical protein